MCGVLAYFFPLEVFILAFAILGPLHYLTEINWLNTNNYFTKHGNKTWLLIGLATSVFIIVPRLYFEFFGRNNTDLVTQLFLKLRYWSNGATFISLTLAFGLQLIKKRRDWYILIALSLFAAYFLNQFETYTVIVGVFIPTIIHVYVFTLLFMLYGARKNKSNAGYISVALAITIPILFTLVHVDTSNYQFDDFFKSALTDNRLDSIPVFLSKFLGLSDGTSFLFYEDLELRLMMFISFIYLYHYLNWFSKTTTIFWHKSLTLKRSLFIAVFWLFLLFLFYLDFKIGFLAALFLSFLHVILEFPLNVISIKSLFQKQ